MLLIALIGCALIACGKTDQTAPQATAAGLPHPEGATVRNIVFMIGDGTGLGQIAAARIRANGARGSLNIDRMPVVGLVKTYAADHLVTDSAAAGTALSAGIKTRNAMIALTPDGRPAYTILEAARDRGLSTGLVVTSTITHATPAVFAAHIEDRGDELSIAAQMLDTGVTVMLGGGRSFFLPQSQAGGKRTDGRNLIKEARTRGYRIIKNADDLRTVDRESRRAGAKLYLGGLMPG